MARAVYQSRSEKFDYPDPWLFNSEEEIPEDLAMSHLANMRADFRVHPQYLLLLTSLVEWLSRTDAEMLYLSADLLQHLKYSWTPDLTRYLIDNDFKWYGTKTGERNVVKFPRRNDPCFCGSGKKFKKCCLHTLPPDFNSNRVFSEAPMGHLGRPKAEFEI